MEELFNLRHSQARNVVERIFGVLKRRWGVFSRAPEYPMETQAMLVPAIAALHNFLRIHDGSDDAQDLENEARDTPQHEGTGRLGEFLELEPREISPEELGMYISDEEKARASARRDRIAKQMWDDYLVELESRGQVPNT
jgi:hypothetical protein